VVCYERADDIGFGVSGVVTRARGIRATLPDLDPSQIPMARPWWRRRSSTCSTPWAPAAAPPRCGWRTARSARCGLHRDHGFELPYTPPFLHKHGGMVLSLGQFMQFVGGE
jgi:electron-transferring-flavoprotein dehydrogenase